MKDVTIKNLKLQAGRPKIAVPITGLTADDIVDQCEAAFEMGADILEWRVDYFLSGLADLKAEIAEESVHLEIIRILDDIDYVTDGMPVIFTIRTKAQGGAVSIGTKEAYDLQSLAAQSELVTLVCVELFDENDTIEEESIIRHIKELQEFGAGVIVSYHDFKSCPSLSEINNLVNLMREFGADICKVAGTVATRDEAVDVLKAAAAATAGDKGPVIILGMGKEGLITRVVGGKYGSCITFAATDKATAPGQVSVKSMQKMLDDYYGE